jgi:hypothetical protein
MDYIIWRHSPVDLNRNVKFIWFYADVFFTEIGFGHLLSNSKLFFYVRVKRIQNRENILVFKHFVRRRKKKKKWKQEKQTNEGGVERLFPGDYVVGSQLAEMQTAEYQMCQCATTLAISCTKRCVTLSCRSCRKCKNVLALSLLYNSYLCDYSHKAIHCALWQSVS